VLTKIGADNALSKNSILTVNTATFDLNGFNQEVAGLTGTSASTIINNVAGTKTLTINSTAAQTFAGILGNGAGTLAIDKKGAGVLTLSGANTYIGATTIEAGGVLKISNATALGATSTGTTVTSGGQLQTSGTLAIAEPLNLNGTGLASDGALLITANGPTLSGPIALGSSGVRIQNNGASATISGGISGVGFDLAIGGTAGWTVGTSAINIGGGTLTKDGGTTTILRLDTANTIGAISLNSGGLNVGNAGCFGSATITVGSGIGTPADTGGFLAGSGLSTLNVNNDIVLSAGAICGLAPAGSGTILNLAGTISGNGSLKRNRMSGTGAGTVQLSGANTFSGGVIHQSDPLMLNNKSALGTGSYLIGTAVGAVDPTPTISAATDLSGLNALANAVVINTNFTISGANNLEFSGPVSLAASRTITVSSSASTIFSGPITGVGLGITKAGTGILALSGTSTYSGATIINAGKLLVNGSLNSSPVTVQTSATLGGNGTIGGTVVVDSGATIAPGTSIGTLTLAVAPVLNGTNLMEIDRNGGTPLADKLVVNSGTLTYGGTLTVVNLGAALLAGDTFNLFGASGFGGSFPIINLPALSSGLVWDVSALTTLGRIKVACNGSLSASAGNNQTICNGSSVGIGGSPTASAGSGTYTYSWSPPTGLSSTSVANPTASPSITTSYTVTVSDSVGCTAQSSVTVTVNPRPTSVVSGSSTTCNGGSAVIQAVLTGTGPWNVTWSDSVTQTGVATSPATRTVNPGSTTTYDVTALSDANCIAQPGDLTGSAVVTPNTTPAISSGPTPSSQAACNGGSMNISVSATGDLLGYAWRKRGTGWGGSGSWALNTPSGSGAFYVGSSTDNDNFETASNGGNDINTSGKAWGIYNSGGVSDAIRNFANLAVGQSVSVDMDNGSIDGTVGLGLQNSSGQNRLEFYFVGGDSNYTVNDGTPHNSGIAFTRQGVNVKFTLTGTDTYSITIKRYIDNATATLTGTLSGTAGTAISRIRLFSANGGGGTDHNLYFNNIAAGVDDDNASNYTAWNSGDNFGNSGLSNGGNISGADTASLTINPVGAVDAGSYDVVIFNTCGQITSSAAALTVNPRPTAVVTGGATICNGGSTMVQAALTGTGPWNVTWSDGFIQTANVSPATRSVSPSSTFTYTVATLSDFNCVAQAGDLTGSALVTVNPRPTAVVSGNATICNGQSTLIQAALTGTGPWSVTWSDGFSHSVAVSPDVRTVSPGSSITYTVTALVDFNCTAQPGDLTGSAAVVVNPRPTSVVSGSTTICPGASTTIQAALTGTGPWSVTWSDGFTHSVNISPDSRLVSPASTITYTVTALSDANCTAQAGDRTGSAVVTVEDSTVPIITCPANITVTTAAGTCSSNVTFSVGATDNCGTPNVVSVPPSGYAFPRGTTTVTNTADDGNGNSSQCTFTITVVDSEPPAITCPANITVSTALGQCTSNVTFTVTAADNCGTVNLVTDPPSGFAFPKGTNTVTSIADDGHGNTNQCSFTVTVLDTEAPFVNCGQNETVSCMQGWGFTVPIVNDNCDTGLIPVVFSTTTNAGCGYTFTATRIWQVTDSSFNVTYCTQVVTTVDFIPPTITFCPPNVTVQCVSDIPVPNPGSVSADNSFDPCETTAPVVTFFSDVTNSLSPLTITRTYHASDACGNFVSCTHTITVHDSMPPIVTLGTIATCYTNVASAEAAAIAATGVSDNCDTNPAVTAATVGTCNATITVTATDATGNSANVQYTTHIAAPPVIGTVTATESSLDVKDCAHIVVQGSVLISVQASAACGLTGGHPNITLTNGTVAETATYDNESPAGTFNYHWDATVATSNGTWTVTIAASDLCQTTTSQFTLCLNSSQISGQVQLENFVGTGTVPTHTRTVTFVATDGVGAGANVLKTWTLTLSNVSGDTFDYTLIEVPVATVAVSAKTDWTLRSKVAVTFALNGSFNPVNFTGAKRLRGGDFDGSNTISFNDYSILGINFFTFNPVADITGDGDVDFDEYATLAGNWMTTGDPE
jgi:autotransporter-associated beta strand protein